MMTAYFKYILLSFALLLSACAINPVTGDRDFVTLSEAEEISQGRQLHQSVIEQYGVYDDPNLQSYVNTIGQQLAANSHRAHLEFHFTVLDSPDINAFALPGGYIYITRGIMAYLGNEAELAGVLGHEIGHVTARHSVRQQSGQFATGLLNVLIAATTGSESLGKLGNQLGTGIIRGYGRKHELEADRLGAQYLHKSAYDPESMLDVIGVLKDQELYEKALAEKQNRPAKIYHGVYSTHPKNDDRLQAVILAAKNLSPVQYRDVNQATYFELIDGMTWGQSADQGVILQNRFMHAKLGIALQFPPRWQVINNPNSLFARDQESGALVQLNLETLRKGENSLALLKRLTNNNKLMVKQTNYGATAAAQAKIDGKNQPARVSAIKLDNKQVLFIAGTSAQAVFASVDMELLAINASFTRLSDLQIENIKTPMLKIVAVKAGDKFATVASQSAINQDAENVLRLLNRAYPDGAIRVGQKLKTIMIDN